MSVLVAKLANHENAMNSHLGCCLLWLIMMNLKTQLHCSIKLLFVNTYRLLQRMHLMKWIKGSKCSDDNTFSKLKRLMASNIHWNFYEFIITYMCQYYLCWWRLIIYGGSLDQSQEAFRVVSCCYLNSLRPYLEIRIYVCIFTDLGVQMLWYQQTGFGF